jgi:haloacetate dehalogenase
MNRREFGALGVNAAAALLPTKSMEAEVPKSSTCVELPELPAPPSAAITEKLFPGFTSEYVKTHGATIRVLRKGDGPPLLLLHGHPESHVTWHRIAGELAKEYSVVIPDLRGYGDSSKPDGGERHINYSFRAMAQDQIDVMRHFGHETFFVAGHDRGARVAHRLCLDHPESVRKVCLMDIAPTLTMYRDTNKEFATKYVWWFLLIQPFPQPEHLLGLDAAGYLQDHLLVQGKTGGFVTPDAMSEYLRCFCCKATIHAGCEDYRAAADIDLEMDQADDDAGRRIAAPVLALWGGKGVIGTMWDVLAVWRAKSSSTVSGHALDCGHFLPEEKPDEVLAELRRFFAAGEGSPSTHKH